MTPLVARLVALALSLGQPYYPPGKAPETAAQREERVSAIIRAADAVEDPPEWPGTHDELVAALLAVSWYESGRWRLEVHDGRVRGDHRRSVCLAQVHGGGDDLVGTDFEATVRCFRRAAEIFASNSSVCA